jgi:hypothetical protein
MVYESVYLSYIIVLTSPEHIKVYFLIAHYILLLRLDYAEK